MKRARCLADGTDYEASEFSRLDPVALDQLRRELVCVACGARAFFRAQSRDGRVACFGSNDHRVDCPEAAGHSTTLQPPDQPLSGVDVIHVRLVTQSQPAEDRRESVGERGDNERKDASAEVHRSLRTLLWHVINEPAFLYSDTRIASPGFPTLSAHDFFVRFEQITSSHVDQYRGYWGTVISYGMGAPSPRPTSARTAAGGEDFDELTLATGWEPGRVLWLNSGPPREPSILIQPHQVRELIRTQKLTTFEDLVGCYVLSLGQCVKSSRGKVYTRPLTAAHLTFDRAA